eukprot:scaffold12165_cov102-Isochrysis_galbana.AAC.2
MTSRGPSAPCGVRIHYRTRADTRRTGVSGAREVATRPGQEKEALPKGALQFQLAGEEVLVRMQVRHEIVIALLQSRVRHAPSLWNRDP